MKDHIYDAWPALPFNEFKSTARLLHMGVQAIGKFKLHTPFEAHWSNVPLWLTSRGMTTGAISYRGGAFSIDLDFISHQVICHTSWGLTHRFMIESMSVADFVQKLLAGLSELNIDLQINMQPQEIPNPIPFDQDTERQSYDRELANAFWRILLSTHRVLKQYHARFDGESPPVGFMWGTFDIRDARYNGIHVPTTGINAGYIRRNAMNEAQVEAGFWPGNPEYQKAAFYSFAYPAPEGIEKTKIKPSDASWNKTLGEFILNYDDLRQSNNPDADLLAFFESAYQAASKHAEGWKKEFITTGEPV